MSIVGSLACTVSSLSPSRYPSLYTYTKTSAKKKTIRYYRPACWYRFLYVDLERRCLSKDVYIHILSLSLPLSRSIDDDRYGGRKNCNGSALALQYFSKPLQPRESNLSPTTSSSPTRKNTLGAKRGDGMAKALLPWPAVV